MAASIPVAKIQILFYGVAVRHHFVQIEQHSHVKTLRAETVWVAFH